MAVAGSIVANLTANTVGWSSGLGKAGKALAAFSAVTVGAVVQSVRSFGQVGDALNKMAARTQFSVETLSQLGFAAEQNGSSLETLGASLFRANRRIANFTQGTGPAVRALSAMGFAADDFASGDRERQFFNVVAALEAVESPTLRAQYAFEIFGDQARSLMPLLNSGTASIRELMREADSLGKTMTTDAAQSAADYGDALNRLNTAVKGVSLTVGGLFAPAVAESATWLARLVAEHRDGIVFASKMAVALVAVVAAVKAVTIATQAYTKAAAVAAALSGPKGWIALAAGAAIATGTFIALDQAFEGTNEQLAQLPETQQQALAGFDQMSAGMRKAADNGRDLSQSVDTIRKQFLSFQPDIVQTRTEIAELTKAWREQREAGAQGTLAFDDFDRLRTSIRESRSGFTGAFDQLRNELRVLRGDIDETGLQFERFAEFGVADFKVDKFRDMLAERERLQAAADERTAQRRAAEERASGLSSFAETVRNAIRTPLDTFKEQVRQVRAAVKSGDLSKSEGLAFLKKQRDALEAATSPEAVNRRRAALATAVSVRSQAGQNQLVSLLNRGTSGDSVADNQLKEAKKQTSAVTMAEKWLKDLRDSWEKSPPLKIAAFGAVG